jgi:hypothetical protein
MFHFDLKTFTLCLVGFVAAGSVFAQLKTWNRFREQEHKELLTAIIIYMTFAVFIALLVVAVWTT